MDVFELRKSTVYRSPIPTPSLRKDHQGASEAQRWRQMETLEERRNRQGRTSGPTAIPRMEREEMETSALWGTSFHHQGPLGIKSGQEQGPPQELDPQVKSQRAAPRRKRAHTIGLNEPETYAKPKVPREPHTRTTQNPHQARRGQTNPTPKRISRMRSDG